MGAADDVNDMRFAFEGLGRQVDQVTRLQLKLKDAYFSTRVGGIHLLIRSLKTLSKASVGLYKDSTNIIKAQEDLTVASSVVHGIFLEGAPLVKMMGDRFAVLNARYEKNRTHLKFLGLRMYTVWASLLTLGILISATVIGLGLFELAVNGSDSALLKMADGIIILETALLGLQFAMTGEGEGGFFDGILGSGLLALLMLGLMGKRMGKITLVLGLLGTAFHAVEKATGSTTAAWAVNVAGMAGLITFHASKLTWLVSIYSWLHMTIMSFFYAVNPAWVSMARVASLGVAGTVAAVSLLVGGIYGLYKVASGAMSDITAIIVGIFSAIAIGVGLFILGVAAIPAAIIAAFLLSIAFIYRWRDEIWGAFLWIGAKYNEFKLRTRMFAMGIITAMMTIPSRIYIGFVDGLNQISDWITNWVDGVVEQIDYLKSKLDFDLEMPGSGIIGSARDLFRAEGGPVTGGRPYIVGEKGPELFVPGSSGGIVPNNQLGGSSTSVTLNINVAGVTDRSDKRALAREIGDMLNQELRRQGGSPTRGRF